MGHKFFSCTSHFFFLLYHQRRIRCGLTSIDLIASDLFEHFVRLLVTYHGNLDKLEKKLHLYRPYCECESVILKKILLNFLSTQRKNLLL